MPQEKRCEGALLEIAYSKSLPLVATNEPYFAANDDYEAHDALLCIAGGKLIAETDRDQLTPDHRFKTRAEMALLFADIPEALASTVEIAERFLRAEEAATHAVIFGDRRREIVGDALGERAV